VLDLPSLDLGQNGLEGFQVAVDVTDDGEHVGKAGRWVAKPARPAGSPSRSRANLRGRLTSNFGERKS
jgi:hypothetical protein